MFERFTERARQVVVLAQEEARSFKHGRIGTEHLLLGLLREREGLAARALDSLNLRYEEVRDQVARIAGEGEEATAGEMPFTPRAKKVLELALREALALGHNYLGTEHILLGIAREGEGVAAQVLRAFGRDEEAVRGEVLSQLGPAVPRPFRGIPRPARSRLDAIEERLAEIQKRLEAIERRLGEQSDSPG